MDNIDRRIVELVRASWDSESRPLLLSRLGGEPGIADRAKDEADGLAAYLRLRLADDVKVVQHSAKPSVMAAIPIDARIDSDGVDALLDTTYSRTTDTGRRFVHPALWAAFRAPLDETNERYVKLDAPIRFTDVAPENRPDDRVEIDREYIGGPDATPSRIYENMVQWAERYGLDLADYPSEKLIDTKKLPANDLLGRLLLALDPHELKQISMPLEIVKKLRQESL